MDALFEVFKAALEAGMPAQNALDACRELVSRDYVFGLRFTGLVLDYIESEFEKRLGSLSDSLRKIEKEQSNETH